jgi:hypothetical protein
MLARLKPFFVIFAATLIMALVLGPPVAFASKLPTTCNIFHNKKAAKLGSCGHDVTFSKDKFCSPETAFPNGIESGSIEIPVILQNNQPSCFFPFHILWDSVPLRC